LSLLVRKDLELAAVQRAPELRRLAIEIAAEQAVRTTAMELRRELGHDARERERRMLSAAGHRAVDAAEHDVETLLKEILHLLAAPGRAGINLLERLVAGADPEPPPKDAARPKRQL
jgi:hypothetical protein